MNAEQLSPASESLFKSLAADAPNWNGQPLLDITSAQRGNLTDLKKKGLLKTATDEGCEFVIFTEAGKALAESFGYEVHTEYHNF